MLRPTFLGEERDSEQQRGVAEGAGLRSSSATLTLALFQCLGSLALAHLQGPIGDMSTCSWEA